MHKVFYFLSSNFCFSFTFYINARYCNARSQHRFCRYFESNASPCIASSLCKTKAKTAFQTTNFTELVCASQFWCSVFRLLEILNRYLLADFYAIMRQYSSVVFDISFLVWGIFSFNDDILLYFGS